MFFTEELIKYRTLTWSQRDCFWSVETPAALKRNAEKPTAPTADVHPRICLQEAAFGCEINIYLLRVFLEREVVCHLVEPQKIRKLPLKKNKKSPKDSSNKQRDPAITDGQLSQWKVSDIFWITANPCV